jgi:hypothetical protein
MTEADLSEESDVAGWREECGRRQRPAPRAECDRLDALDAVEPSFDDVLPFPGLEVK